MTTFKELGLGDMLVQSLIKKGYSSPTPVQVKAIPEILNRRDVLVSAQTGTGKTAAFTLPIIQLMSDSQAASPKRSLRTLILTPTRELALQIADNLSHYKQHTTLKHTVIFGGVSQHRQVEAIRSGTDILVATPGRLLDLIQQKHLNLSSVQFFVLDEADRMLDSGFLTEVKKIIAMLPSEKQTLLFSATVPPAVEALSSRLLRNRVEVYVKPEQSNLERIAESVYYVEKRDKQALLVHLIRSKAMDRVLVFTTMKHHADKLSRSLKQAGISSDAIHGNKSQNERQKVLDRFKSRKLNVLIATDVVSRGIDIDDLSHVINYELPDVAETYVHRIGRTGRKGRSGVAISFCSQEEKSNLNDIQKLKASKIKVAVNA